MLQRYTRAGIACSFRRLSSQLPYVVHRGVLTQAYVEGPRDPPLLDETIGQNFARIVSSFGDRNAVISRHQDIKLTYRGLDEHSNALARGLAKQGVSKGDRVAVSMGNNAEFATVTYALYKLGAILVPLNPAFTANQIISALSHLSASHLMIGLETNLPWKKPTSNIPILTSLIPDLYSSSTATQLSISETVPSLKRIIFLDNSQGRIDGSKLTALTPYRDVFENGGDGGRVCEDKSLHPDEIATIQFTSGTTSMPKAACLTHRGILNNGKSIGDRMLLTEKDIVVCPPPLFHCFGCILGYMATATHGSAIVFPAEAFSPLATLLSIQENAATAVYGVPTMFLSYLELLSDGTVPKTGFENLRTGIASGASVPIELMRKLHKVLNLTELTICYGMTETSPVSLMCTTDDPLEKRVSTVGRCLPNVAVKVVDPNDHGKILGVGEQGELAVSGYLVMKGYWGDEKKTREAMIPDSDGRIWMHTGDEGLIDPDGYIQITGRLKDIIIRGGENIHPLDIENRLLAHPAVSDVSCCGVPDDKYGEVVAVFVVMRKGEVLGEEDVRAWVRGGLGGHFVPKYVFYTDNFPKTPSGKVQRFKLREEAQERLKAGVTK